MSVRWRQERGFTLVETIISLLIIGLAMGISVIGLNAVTSAKLREESGRLAAVVRGVYVLAATNGRHYRIVFDIDGGRYHVEYTDDPVLLEQERTGVKDGKRVEDASVDRRIRTGVSLGIGPATPRLPKPGWHKASKMDIGLMDGDDQSLVLSKEIEIEGVFTTHQVDVYTKGKAELYFFPSGWTEPAIIYLREKGTKGDTFSVEVDALTGRATIHHKKIAIPREYLEERGKEEEGEKVF